MADDWRQNSVREFKDVDFMGMDNKANSPEGQIASNVTCVQASGIV